MSGIWLTPAPMSVPFTIVAPPAGLIEKRPESQILLHLDQIENVKSVFEKVDVTDLHVLTEGLEVEGALK